MSVCRGWGLRDPAPLWGDDPLRLSGPTELERETEQESAGAEPPQRHLLLCHQHTCSESWAQTLKVWVYGRVTGSLVSPATQAVKILSVSLVFMFHSLLQPAELLSLSLYMLQRGLVYRRPHVERHIWTGGRQDRSWCQNQFISNRQSVESVHGSSTANIFTAAIFRHMFKHRQKDSKLTRGNYSHTYG